MPTQIFERKEMLHIQVNVPFVAALRAPGMRDRHWKRLCEMLDIDVSPNSTTRTLIEEFNLIQYSLQCEEVGSEIPICSVYSVYDLDPGKNL